MRGFGLRRRLRVGLGRRLGLWLAVRIRIGGGFWVPTRGGATKFGWKFGCVRDWLLDWMVDQFLVWQVGWLFGCWFG